MHTPNLLHFAASQCEAINSAAKAINHLGSLRRFLLPLPCLHCLKKLFLTGLNLCSIAARDSLLSTSSQQELVSKLYHTTRYVGPHLATLDCPLLPGTAFQLLLLEVTAAAHTAHKHKYWRQYTSSPSSSPPVSPPSPKSFHFLLFSLLRPYSFPPFSQTSQLLDSTHRDSKDIEMNTAESSQVRTAGL